MQQRLRIVEIMSLYWKSWIFPGLWIILKAISDLSCEFPISSGYIVFSTEF